MGSMTSTGFFIIYSQRFNKFVSSIKHPKFIAKTSSPLTREKHAKWLRCAEKQQQEHNITDCIDRVTKTKQMVTFL